MTKLPQSSISFNTPDFLRVQLDMLILSGRVQSWMYVFHHAEEDTKKDHIHLIVIPCKTINPVALRKEFVEPCSIDKTPLGCLPFVTSKIGDWLLYALHYEPYLLSKGLFREHHYDISDIVSNEPREYVDQVFSEACESLTTSRIKIFTSRAISGATLGELMAEGVVPPNQIIFYDKLYRQYALPTRIVRSQEQKSCNTNQDDVPF